MKKYYLLFLVRVNHPIQIKLKIDINEILNSYKILEKKLMNLKISIKIKIFRKI